MTIDRIYTPGLAQVAYLVTDADTGVAAVIDPPPAGRLTMRDSRACTVIHPFCVRLHDVTAYTCR